jgi:predicted ribosomally synthesized peptide with SipW-like signal peptide
MNKKALLSLVLVGSLSLGAAAGSYAWFTSQATSAANTVQTGELKFNLTANIDDGKQNPIALSSKFQPGDVITVGANRQPGSFKVEITNNGDFDMVYFDNFKVEYDTGNMLDVIYIKNAKNTLYKVDGTEAWTDQYIVNGTPKYTYNDANGDGKLSLREWLAKENVALDLGNGWHYSALKIGAKFVTEYELAIDENADNRYINKSIQLAYQTYSTQYRHGAPEAMVTTIGADRGTGIQWSHLDRQYNQQ